MWSSHDLLRRVWSQGRSELGCSCCSLLSRAPALQRLEFGPSRHAQSAAVGLHLTTVGLWVNRYPIFWWQEKLIENQFVLHSSRPCAHHPLRSRRLVYFPALGFFAQGKTLPWTTFCFVKVQTRPASSMHS